MKIARALKSYAFRWTSSYVIVLSVSVFALQAFIYANYSYYYFDTVYDDMTHELDSLIDVFEKRGAAKAEQLIEGRAAGNPLTPNQYLIVDNAGKKLVGNIDTWPDYPPNNWSWFDFELTPLIYRPASRFRKPQQPDYVALTRELSSGNRAMVARDFREIKHSISLVASAIVHSMAVTIIFGIIGGIIVAVKSAGQIDGINRSIQRIMAGDLSQRLNDESFHGEYRYLTANMNIMLERIQMLMRGVRNMSDNIAHDLRTPLTRLRNKLAQLPEAKTTHAEAVQSLIDDADEILSTFSAILRISQVEAGNRRSEFADLDPKVIVLDVIELYEPLAYEKPLNLTVEVEDNLQVSGDRHLLFQAFANLIDNAMKYTPEGGDVAVSLSTVGDEIQFVVKDTGVGVQESEREDVFRRFYRIEASRSQPGNGLGLSLVWAVVRLHGGDIVLTDNHPGLVVTITLPHAG